MEEIQKVKKLIYVGKDVNDELEEICRQNKIVITSRFKNQYNMTQLFKESLQAIYNIDFLVLDLAAFIGSTDNDEIIRNLDRLRGNYQFRIILIASGFRKGNELLATCFNMGIYNLVTASNSNQMYDQLNTCLSDEGMTYAQATQYRMDLNQISKSNNREIIRTEYEKVRQDISIGVLSTCPHIGATSWGINLLNFLNTLPNVRACLIEDNAHHDIECIGSKTEINKMGVEYFPKAKEVKVGGMEMFYDISKIADIKQEGFDFYIYDLGSIQELDDKELASFLNKDIKFLVCGSKAWEEKRMIDSFTKLNVSEGQDGLYMIFNFTKPEERNYIKNQMGNFNIYFNDYNPDPFILHSQGYLEEILKRYLTNVNYEQVEKKKKKFNLFSRR